MSNPSVPTVPTEEEARRQAAAGQPSPEDMRQYIDNLVNQRVAEAEAARQVTTGVRAGIDLTKLLPRPKSFTGKSENARDFLRSVEQFMRLVGVPFDDRLSVMYATCFLEGAARRWWPSRHEHDPAIATFAHFQEIFLKQFAPIDEHKDARFKLDRLVQRGPVSAYVEQFLAIAVSLPDTSEADLTFNFIKNLKPQVRLMVEAAQPKKLDDAMRIATNIDRSIYAWRSFTSKSFRPTRTFFGPPAAGSSAASASEAVPMELGALMAPPRPKKFQRPPLVCWRCNKVGHKMAQCKMSPQQGSKPLRQPAT